MNTAWPTYQTAESVRPQARRQFVLFNDLFQQLDEEQRNSDPEVQGLLPVAEKLYPVGLPVQVNEQRQLLQRVLNSGAK